MKIDKILDFRFLAPPGVAFILFFLLLPEGFINGITSTPSVVWLGGITSMLVLGFICSSITECVINCFGGKVNHECLDDYKTIKSTKNLHLTKHETWALESSQWKVLDEIGSDGVKEQVYKRWGMAMTNYNMCVAIVFVWAIVIPIYLYKYHQANWPGYTCWIFVASLILLIVLFHNARNAHKSVLGMHKIFSKKLLQDQIELI